MIEIAKIRPDEGPDAVRLILAQFERFIFPDYTDQGKEEVGSHVTAPSLVADDTENFALVARVSGPLVGIAKMKRRNHLSMLFVAAACHGRGLGRDLLTAAIDECTSRHPDVKCITANSSRFALRFFTKHGFKPVDAEQDYHGIRFTPVRKDLG